MSHLALYRRLRPQNFHEIIGQENIIRTLQNQISSKTISHAYLFCGTRGTGKTSTAKVFSKAINCQTPIDGEPCNNCESCKAINEGRSVNVIEIDAASNNGVENIRDIREDVRYVPTEGEYKVYIIDEVHMLSIGAFNALLKTLEEPPSHTIFILATTDQQKIPATILSRCQRFDFKRITHKEMENAIIGHLESENIDITPDALDYIIRISDGAMRDALSTLDQCSAFYFGETITLEKVLDLLGAVDDSVFFNLVEFIYNGETLKCLEIIDSAIDNGRDISQLITSLITHIRNLLVISSTDDATNILDLSAENYERLKKQSEKIELGILLQFIEVFSALLNQMRYSPNERILLEITVIKLCNPSADENNESMLLSIKELENRLNNQNVATPTKNNTAEKMDTKKVDTPKVSQNVVSDKAIPNDKSPVNEGYVSVEEREAFINSFSGLLKNQLSHSQIFKGEDGLITIVAPEAVTKQLLESNKATIAEKYNTEIILLEKSEYEKMAHTDTSQNFTHLLGTDIIFE